MTTFDVHQHLWPPAVVELLTRRRRPPCISEGIVRIPGRSAVPFDEAQSDVGCRLAQLDADGIDLAVVSLSPTDCFDAELTAAWEVAMPEVSRAAGGRLIPLAARRPAPGFAGVCISAADLIGDFDRLAGPVAAAGEVLFVHPGPASAPPPGVPVWWPGAFDYAAQMQAALVAWLGGPGRRAGGPPVIFAILAGGAAILLDRLRARGAELAPVDDHRLYLDTASFGEAAIRFCRDQVGSGRLLYGSDAPVISSQRTLAAVRGLGASDAAAVLSTNPASLYGSFIPERSQCQTL
jgi:hypothetical protein